MIFHVFEITKFEKYWVILTSDFWDENFIFIYHYNQKTIIFKKKPSSY